MQGLILCDDNGTPLRFKARDLENPEAVMTVNLITTPGSAGYGKVITIAVPAEQMSQEESSIPVDGDLKDQMEASDAEEQRLIARRTAEARGEAPPDESAPKQRARRGAKVTPAT